MLHRLVRCITSRKTTEYPRNILSSPIPMDERFKSMICGYRLLGMPVRFPRGPWISVSCECCVLSEFSRTGRSLVQRNPTVCDVLSCMIYKPPAVGCCARRKTCYHFHIFEFWVYSTASLDKMSQSKIMLNLTSHKHTIKFILTRWFKIRRMFLTIN